MQYIKGLEAYCGDKRTAVTLGKFDGLHRGHEKLIEKVIEYAKEKDLESVVCSFNMIPYFDSLRIKREILMTKEEQRLRLEGRIDKLVDCPFTKSFSLIPAEDFIRDVLAGLFRAAYVVVGTDFCFGYQKRGNIHMLKEYQEKYGYKLIVIEKERYHGRIISSTYIKEALAEGDLALANRLLGYPYTIMGIVEHGKQLGRKLGFPTLNVAPKEHKVIPPKGVYVSRTYVDGCGYDGICNIGVKPTVAEEERMLVESYLFEYHGNAYGKKAATELHEFRRPERKFADVSEMKACIDKDIAYGKNFFVNSNKICI